MKKQGKIRILAAGLVSAVFVSLSAGTCFAGSWKQDQGKWWYDLGGGSRATGWQWIDSDGDGKAESYFFDAGGTLVTDTTTPDGFQVNEKGAWVMNGKIQTLAADVVSQFFQAPPLPSEDAGAAEKQEARQKEEAAETAPPEEETVTAEETRAAEESTAAKKSAAEESTAAAEETTEEESTAAAEESPSAEETTAAQTASAAEDAGTSLQEGQEGGPGAAAPETAAAEQSAAQNSLGQAIVEKARTYVKVLPYVYGGTSLATGADCAGFTQAIFALFGKTLPRATGAQLEGGTRISKEELQPGDLVFWANSSGRVYHVGIYSGPDSFIHASNTARGWVFEDHLHDMHEPCGYARY